MTHNNKYNETSREELEAYQEKQFEDYLRMNPVGYRNVGKKLSVANYRD
jgi:hypothetical protein